MTAVLVRLDNGDADTCGDCHVTPEAENGVTRLPAKGHRGLLAAPELGGGEEGPSREPSERSPADSFILDLQPPALSGRTPAVGRPPAGGASLWQP